MALGPANEITLLTQYGTVPREIFYTGRSEDAGLLVANGLTGDRYRRASAKFPDT